MSDELIITSSFNGLLDRVAKIDFFDVWLTGKKILKKAKRDRIEAIMRLSEVLTQTGLRREDVELFVSLDLISVIEAGEDPLLSFKDVFCLVKIFECFMRGVNLKSFPLFDDRITWGNRARAQVKLNSTQMNHFRQYEVLVF